MKCTAYPDLILLIVLLLLILGVSLQGAGLSLRTLLASSSRFSPLPGSLATRASGLFLAWATRRANLGARPAGGQTEHLLQCIKVEGYTKSIARAAGGQTKHLQQCVNVEGYTISMEESLKDVNERRLRDAYWVLDVKGINLKSTSVSKRHTYMNNKVFSDDKLTCVL